MIDLVGQRFGRLIVLAFHSYGAKWNTKWHCQCDCGNQKAVFGHALRRGDTRSCGCLHREITSATSTTHGQSRAGRWSPEYRAWSGMLMRCENPNVKNFDRYGGRGVAVCERWHKFESFFADMGPRPSSAHSLDRWPDNDGHYEPGNCRWATRPEQNRNKSNNVFVTVNGQTLVQSEACRLYGISHSRARGRIKSGWSEQDAFTVPVKNRASQLTNERITE
jgi:hypothetical protein